MKLKIGDQIPSFSLKDQNGNIRNSDQFNKPLVLFFYPKDDTPGCTIEACGFRDKYDLFKILGAEVWGVSNGNTQSHLDFANKSLRILSGLYGILKPSDLIMPYRLEMGTNISIGQYKNLYYFWKDIITDYLLNDIKDDNFLINLASNEYFKVINSKKVNMPIITPIFKDTKNGKTKVISFYAKKARGSMCNYIIKNKINDIEGIKGFNGLGYSFNDSLSNQDSFIFTRNHQ